ncbi:hypothetical protein OIU76_026911 [Salix suchowensis]|nr:hypothetical protein OIU76_026911 [Salix suchowensis]
MLPTTTRRTLLRSSAVKHVPSASGLQNSIKHMVSWTGGVRWMEFDNHDCESYHGAYMMNRNSGSLRNPCQMDPRKADFVLPLKFFEKLGIARCPMKGSHPSFRIKW